MLYKRLFKQTLCAKVSGKRPVGKPRTRWLDYIEDLGWNRLGLYPSEMQYVLVDRAVWRLNLETLHLQPSRKSGWRKKKKVTSIFEVFLATFLFYKLTDLLLFTEVTLLEYFNLGKVHDILKIWL